MAQHELVELLRRFDHAMLVTRHGAQLRSRPMAIAEITDGARLWFMTQADSGKLDELAEHAEVNVAFQKNARFMSITGTARAVRDPVKAEALWTAPQRAWFPDGPHDATLVLIEVIPRVAEYWDRSGLKGLQFALAQATAIARGRRLEDAGNGHRKVVLD